MIGWLFQDFIPPEEGNSFERLLKVFKDLILHTSGDVSEALSWMTELDKRYVLTDSSYGIADFIQELIDKGYITQQSAGREMEYTPTAKLESTLRKHALDDIFQQLKKSKTGNHTHTLPGQGEEFTSEMRPFEFGDKLDHIAMTETIRNAQIHHGVDDFFVTEKDLEVHETYSKSQTSTVLMIDISHSMILYGEDRITPAKKVAMALSELITTRYPKDTLDIIVFGDDAWRIEVKDLPYLQVGPYHTNTVAGIELAMDILRKRKNPNKQIFMITDGKPTCIRKGKKYYKNSFGLDRTILSRTLSLASMCRKSGIPITTFMIARDPWLVRFVEQFTQANQGKAFYSTLDGLGEFLFRDYKKSKHNGKGRA